MKKNNKKEIFSWCLYDFANSSYTTIILTLAFSVYFTEVVMPGAEGKKVWGWTYALSMLTIGIMSPLLGAIADYGKLKKKLLFLFTYICIISTAFLYFVDAGDIALAVILIFISNIGFTGGMHFYNSFLIDISYEENIGRISGYGWSLGYIGGLLSLVLAYNFLKDGVTNPDFRLSFPMVSLFFAVFSIPTFLFLHEEPSPEAKEVKHYLSHGLKRIKRTFHEIKKFKEIVKYFPGYLLYTDAINTVVIFSAIFASQVLGFTPTELLIYFIITQSTASLGAWGFGFISDTIGPKKSITITLIMWVVVVVSAYFVQTKFQFYIIGIIASSAMGANQSASRSMIGLFTPHGKNAEFFGFYAMMGKFAAILGPILYGEVTAATGSQRYALLSLGLFFLVGLILLQFVNEKRGIEAAKEFSRVNSANE